MKKYDVSISSKEMYPEVASNKKSIVRPQFAVKESQFPPVKGKDLSDGFTIEADVRVRSLEKRGKNFAEYTLEIIRMGIKGGEKEFEKLSDDEQHQYMRKSIGLY